MRIGKYKKAAADRKRLVIDYADWLDLDEKVTSVTMDAFLSSDNCGRVEAPIPPEDTFYVDGYVVSATGKEVVFFVSGGLHDTAYDVMVTVRTSKQQTKKDWVTFVVTN